MNNPPQTLAIDIGDVELPHGSYRLVAGAGHLIPMEKPKEIIRIIADFLRALQLNVSEFLQLNENIGYF